MAKLYLCMCYPTPNTIESFKKSFGPDHYLHKLKEFCLELLVANDVVQSDNVQERLIIERNNEPYFSMVLSQELKGNLSHMLRFMDVKFEEVANTREAMEKLNNYK